MPDLGGSGSAAHAINDSGQVAGFSQVAGDIAYHAFLYSDGVMHDLGALFDGSRYTNALGINNSGHVVGQGISGQEEVAWLYDVNNMLDICAITDCKSKGWEYLRSAEDINDRGDIVGTGLINGEWHAFLVVVPIPPAVWLFGSGLIGLIGIARRKKT